MLLIIPTLGFLSADNAALHTCGMREMDIPVRQTAVLAVDCWPAQVLASSSASLLEGPIVSGP